LRRCEERGTVEVLVQWTGSLLLGRHCVSNSGAPAKFLAVGIGSPARICSDAHRELRGAPLFSAIESFG
jgi:hypothetical protein